jgi:hypothetical protein
LTWRENLQNVPKIESILGKLESGKEFQDIKQLQQNDEDIKMSLKYKLLNELPEDQKVAKRIVIESDQLVVENGILYHLYQPRGRKRGDTDIVKQLVVPFSLRNDVLISYHDTLHSGHAAFERCYEKVRLKYYWKSMYADIKCYIESCEVCQKSKRNPHVSKAPLQPMPIGEPFSRIHLDFLGPLPTSPEGYKHILY